MDICQNATTFRQLTDQDAVRHYEAGRLGSITGHGAMEMEGACFVCITRHPPHQPERRIMDTSARSALLIYTVVAAGINSGAFFIFSNFVMASLGRLAPAEGARAMQEMNRAAPNPLFMATLMGGGITGAVLAGTASGQSGAAWQVAGGIMSLATMLITVTFHVPRNNRLDAVDADSTVGQAVWADYRRSWTRGNHVRTATSTLSVLCLLLAAAS